MATILGHAVILVLAHSKILVSGAEDVREKFKEFRVVPDVIPIAPSELAEVVYPDDTRVLLGNEIQQNKMLTAPDVDWDADPNSYYTLAMIGSLAQFAHWLVSNIPGNDVANGETLASYVPPLPPPATGSHRYIFLIYEQSKTFNTTLLDFIKTQLRVNFSISDFAVKYELGNPLFGCFSLVKILP